MMNEELSNGYLFRASSVETLENSSYVLKVLYVHYNKLKKLPETLGDLSKLQSLNVSHNNIKELPKTLGRLPRLKTLDLAGNAKLTRLEKSMAHIRSLETLTLDADNLVYPEAAVCRQGTEQIMRFLCKGQLMCHREQWFLSLSTARFKNLIMTVEECATTFSKSLF